MLKSLPGLALLALLLTPAAAQDGWQIRPGDAHDAAEVIRIYFSPVKGMQIRREGERTCGLDGRVVRVRSAMIGTLGTTLTGARLLDRPVRIHAELDGQRIDLVIPAGRGTTEVDLPTLDLLTGCQGGRGTIIRASIETDGGPQPLPADTIVGFFVAVGF